MGKASQIAAGLFAMTALAISTAALAQPPGPPPSSMTPEARREVVTAAAATLRARYVFPDVAETASARLESRLAAGAYDTITDPGAFARQLTADLADVAHDKHLRVSARGAAPAPGGSAPAPPPANEGGIVRADRLAGNIGYIEIIAFPPPAAFKPVLDQAMAALADTRALIIDDRRNGGGSPDAVAYLVSFFEPNDKPVLLNTFYNRTPSTTTFVSRGSSTSPTPTKYLGKPIYLLTSGNTFSGGEEIAYDLQTFKLAQIVGQTTGGGANPGGQMALTPNFAVFVPNGRPENAITHTNWEGKGVVPDIVVPVEDALRVALQKLGEAPQTADIDSLSKGRLWEVRKTPLPGTEAAARKLVADLAAGQPHYEDMSAGLQTATRGQLPSLRANMERLGALKSVKFAGPGPGGGDSFDMVFENGSINFSLGLTPDGKIDGANFRPI